MARHVDDTWGEHIALLDCPECDYYGDIYYTTKRPSYCSDACKQKAYRRRKAIKKTRQYLKRLPNWLPVPLKQRIVGFGGEYGSVAAQELTEIIAEVARLTARPDQLNS
jgi:hypothetical protein